MNQSLLFLSLNKLLLGLLLFISPMSLLSQQKTFEVGLSYRYVYFEEFDWSFSSERGEALQPNELDAHLRFDIGDRKIRGTFTLGYAKYGANEATFPSLLFFSCGNGSYYAKVQNYHAYRFNPGIEYQIRKGKISYGVGAGIFYYGAFAGKQDEVFSTVYARVDTINGGCIVDSSFLQIVLSKAPAKPVALLGVSLNMYAGYEPVDGVTFFASFSVNPTFSTTNQYFALSPNGSAGVYFRFRTREDEVPK